MTVSGQTNAVAYTFDNADRLTQISQGSNVVSFGYDPTGRRTSLTLPNGIVVSDSYDQASDLTGLSYTLSSNSLGSLAYGYDNDGRRIGLAGSWARTGIPSATTSTAVYNVANELTNWNGATLSYDANGNMTSDDTNSYTWDARNQLGSISGATTASFVYDPFGRRQGKTINTASTNFLYDGLNPIQELSGSTVTANLLTGGVDEYFTRTDALGTSNFLTDALGSTIALADPTGTVQTSYTYQPFGGKSTQGAANGNSYQFTGRENDGTGLYFYRARYYSPTFGRFISEDPAGFEGGISLYGYVGSHPTDAADPTGRSESWIHYEETYDAVMAVYGDPSLARLLAADVAAQDLATQGTSWRDTRRHAMAGRKDNGEEQSCGQAYGSTSQFVADELRGGSLGDLAAAIHTIEDSYAPGHQYKSWPGFLNADTPAHIGGDLSYIPAAEQAVENLLRTNGVLPADVYLHPNPCGGP